VAKVEEQKHAEITKVPGYKHRDLFRTTYMDNFENVKGPRPASAAPDKAKVAFSKEQTVDPLEQPYRRLKKEYATHKARVKSMAQTNGAPRQAWQQKLEKNIENHTNLEKQAAQLESVDKQVPNTPPKQTEETVNVEEEVPRTPPKAQKPSNVDAFTPEKMGVPQELQIRRDLGWKAKAEKTLRGKLDMVLSQNYKEQQKLKEKINKLQDQQKERDYSNRAKEISQHAQYQRDVAKRHYSNYAKRDLTEFIHSKDHKKREYALDRTNLNTTVKTRKQLLDDQLMMTAYNQHLERKNRFLSQSMVASPANGAKYQL
jgi:hypothetical protein